MHGTIKLPAPAGQDALVYDEANPDLLGVVVEKGPEQSLVKFEGRTERIVANQHIRAAEPVSNDDLAEHVAAIRQIVGRMGSDWIEVGRHLTFCHDKVVDHGDWAKWLKQEFDWTTTHALGFMNAYRRFGRGESKVTFDLKRLSAAAVFLLAPPSVPEEAVQEVIKQVKAGNSPKTKEVKEIIAKHKSGAKTKKKKRAKKPDDHEFDEVMSTVERAVHDGVKKLQDSGTDIEPLFNALHRLLDKLEDDSANAEHQSRH
jgi:hypothetical protein